MIKLLFKFVFPLVVMLVIGLVGYNYFFGTPAEKQNAQALVSKVAGLGKDVYDLLVSERDKFDDGKYSQAIDKIGSAISYLRDKVSSQPDGGGQYLNQLNELESQKRELEIQVSNLNLTGNGQSNENLTGRSAGGAQAMTAQQQQIEAQLRELARQTEELGIRIGQ